MSNDGNAHPDHGACAGLRLVSATTEHLDSLAAIHAQAFARPWSVREIHTLMQGAGAIAISAASADQIAGFIIARALAGEGEIVTVAVDPGARRRGVGRALVEAAIAAAQARSAEVLWLEAAVDNNAAISLYRKLGFETAGRRPGYYARGSSPSADALVMRLALDGVLNTEQA